MRYNQPMPNNDGQQTVKYCRINVRLQSQNDTQPMRRNRQTKRIQVLYLPMLMLIRRIIGAFFLILGIIGLLMPIIPVYLSIILGIALLGSRDPWLRFIHLGIIRLLKFIKTRKTPWIRQRGERLFGGYKHARTVVAPLIIRSEHAIARMMGYPSKNPPRA
jgi:hypothetical protein